MSIHQRQTSAADFKAWRKRLDLTQEEAGKRLGVSRVTIQNWESGTTPIPKMAFAACEIEEMRWRQRPEFGPVLMEYWRHRRKVGYGQASPNSNDQVISESFANNETALEKAVELKEREGIFFGLVWSEDRRYLIFGSADLENEIWRRVTTRQNRRSPEEIKARVDAMLEIGRHFSSLPVADPNFTEDDLYDEYGLPK
jgi:DNA-binding XRE family transcriptional regulator